MTISELVGLAIQLSMSLIIFCVALDSRFGDVTFLWRRPGLLLRSLVSMLVVMPVFAVLMAMWFDLNPAVSLRSSHRHWHRCRLSSQASRSRPAENHRMSWAC